MQLIDTGHSKTELSLKMYRIFLLFLIPFTSALSWFSVWDTVITSITSVVSYDSQTEDAHLNIEQLVKKYGYPFEEHNVTTEDGYILNLHRIPHGKRNIVKRNTVAFLMHGIMESSDSWVLQGPKSALAYILADEGFDVWMGNARGNKHSTKHTTLKSDDQQYWDFTWEEIGLYDLPASIDYVLNVTNKNDLYYIGYSQGTTSSYVMTSMKPEYNSKIKMMFSLAPVAWMKNAKSPIVQIFSPANDILGYMLSSFNLYASSTDSFNRISTLMCAMFPIRCDNIMYNTFGYSTKVDEDLIPVILGHSPTGCSILQFVHYGQLVVSGTFSRFDHGESKNMVIYGQENPPDYNCSRITVPVVLFYSGEDWFSDERDVRKLKECLPNVRESIYIEDMSHIDYMYAKMTTNAVYKRIISIIDNYEWDSVYKRMQKLLRFKLFG